MDFDFLDGGELVGGDVGNLHKDVPRAGGERGRDAPFRRRPLPPVEPVDLAFLHLALLAEVDLHPRRLVARKRLPTRQRRTVQQEPHGADVQLGRTPRRPRSRL